MSEPQSKRKKPNYYISKKKKQYILEPGLKGFLCTCNFREKECIQESYNLLNLYADLKPNTPLNNSNTESKETLSDTEDIADELSKEINSIKSDKCRQRFQVVESGAKNLLFIRTTIDNPVGIVSAIINDILSSKQQKTRFLLRLIPIETTCKANMDDIKSTALKLIDKHFTGEEKSFAVVFNHRNNHQLNRDDIIKEIAALISSKNVKHKVDLKNAELSVIVEVIRGICLLSVIPNYNKFKKYNLLQIFESISKEVLTDNLDTNDETK